MKAMAVDNCAMFLNCGFVYRCFSVQGNYKNQLRAMVCEAKSPLPAFLETTRRSFIRQRFKAGVDLRTAEKISVEMASLHAEIVLPMVFKDKVNGFVALGEKRSGDLFTREDIDLLDTLSRQCALAIENAHAYERIDDLNKNLEQKVAQRTASLKQALDEKERTQEHLIRSESLAAIGQLVAGVAHELNNPLASVKSLLQSTLEAMEDLSCKIPLDRDLLDDLRFADKELERAGQIVKSLLGLSRQTHTFTEAVHINAVVKDALRILYNQHKHLSLKIVDRYGENLPEIQGNFANLGQVILNIVQNAIQAVSCNAGTILLSTGFDARRRQVIFKCRDTGPGVPPPIRNDIFKPFFTTKEAGQGTGLGLYICHEIVKKHGGSLVLEDAQERGACFVMRLPVTA
jgi:two-component system NtrC family sensor kinase